MTASEARIRHLAWDGRGGLAALRDAVGQFVPTSAEEFHAEWHGVDVDGVQIAEWRCTDTTGTLRPDPQGALRLDVVLGGQAQYRFTDHQVLAGRGAVLLFQVDRPFAFASYGDFRVAQVRLHRERLPLWAQQLTPAAEGVLTPTSLTAGFAALMERITRAMRDWQAPPPPGTASAIGVLAASLLQDVAAEEAEQADLRGRMVHYIARHLHEQDLGPQRIATQFGISLRWAHRTFNQSDETIARHIRQQRLDAVAGHLLTTGSSHDIGGLARRFGFGGRDQLTRAFKDRYGTTIGRYARDSDPDRTRSAHRV